MALPDGFLEPYELWLVEASGRKPLRFMPPATLSTETVPGQPARWSIDGSNIVFDRPAGDTYSLLFRMRTGFALSDAAPTNWLLTNHPDLYLYGSLLEASHLLIDEESMGIAAARYGRALTDVKRFDGRSRSLGTLGMETQFLPRRVDLETDY